MNIEVQRRHGRLFARRLDGQPLTQEDKDAVRVIADTGDERAMIVETVRSDSGTLRAIKVCSFFLDAHLWVLSDHDFFPPDDDPVFFYDEVSFLKTKSKEELQQILRVKITFPRIRVVQ
jgi:hypothetical protein